MIHGYVDEGRVSIGAFITPSLKRQVATSAFATGKTVSEVVRDALRQYVGSEDKSEAEAPRAA